MSELGLLALALLLVAANAVFVAAEFALVTVSRATVERAVERGNRRGDAVLAALRELSTQLSGAQLGITVTSLLVGFIAEPSMAALLSGPLTALGLPDATITGLAVVLALLLATMFQMIFGELVPKNLAIARPLPVALAVTPAQRAFTALSRPLVGLLNGSANALLRRFGIEPQEELRSARAPQELLSLVRRSAEHGTLGRSTATLVERSLRFGDRTAGEVKTPRVRVTFVDDDEPVSQLLRRTRATGHSRFPVRQGGDTDQIVGVAHVKDAVAVPPERRDEVRVAEIAAAPLVVPETLRLDELLERLREQGLQLAVVIDEFGGTDGVVTLEDVVEEIVGEVADEHDPSMPRVAPQHGGGWLVSGLLRPDEVQAVTGVPVPQGDYDTLAGLVTERLGRVPVVGDTIALGNDIALQVERMDGHRVDRVRVRAPGRDRGEEPGR